MVSLTCSDAASVSIRGRVLAIIFVLFGILLLLYFGRTKIIQIIAKNPTAFQYAMKAKELLGKNRLPISGNNHRAAESFDVPDQVEITIDLAQSNGKYDQFWGGFGYNSFKAGSLDPKNQQLFQLMAESNKKNPGTFNYIRAFNIFTNGDAVTQFGEGCEIYHEDAMGNPQYNWTVCDRVFDYIVSLDFSIIVDFTLMPIEMASNKKRIQPWFGGNMSPPLNHEKWASLVHETTKHLVERYGPEQVSRWYFEVWNEPDLAWLFWIADKDNPNSRLRDWGDMDAYNKLYDYTVAAVKRVHPGLQVGGPVVAGSYIEPFLEHLEEKNYFTGQKGTPVDFLSFHSYGSVFDKVINKIDDIHRTVGKIKKEYQKLPYIVSEFSPSPYDLPWYVSRYPAIWLIATVDAIFNYADQNQRPEFLPRMMIYWTAPVIKNFGENAVDKKTDGIATTLANDLLKLPVFNAFEMLGYLSNERVVVSNSVPFPDYKENLDNEFINLLNAIATRSDSSFEVLVYQFTENEAFSQNKKEYPVKLNIKNIPTRKYYLRKFAISETHGNVYSKWKKLNSPLAPDQSQLDILHKSDDLNLKMPAYEPELTAGTYFEELTLGTNEAILFVFSKQLDEVGPLQPSRIITNKIGTNSAYFEWQAAKAARDGDIASGYEVYENQKLVARTFQNKFSSENLLDNTNYQYQIYSLDEQGNKSDRPLSFTIKTKRDNTSPKLVEVVMYAVNSVAFKFNEPLDEKFAVDINNYQLTNGVTIKSISLDQAKTTVLLETSPHQKGERYTLKIGMVRDRARQPNEIRNYQIAYQFLLNFEDKFDFDNLTSYIWQHIWEEGGLGSYKYDAAGKRLKVMTGDDIGQSFSHSLPESDQGIFQIDFQPIQNYPNGGRFILRLKQSDDSYYQFENSCGYGAGYIKKVVRGFTVDSTSCRNEFQQGLKYNVHVRFSPGEATLSGFNETVKIATNHHPINVIEFEIQLIQQDAYFDNVYYESR